MLELDEVSTWVDGVVGPFTRLGLSAAAPDCEYGQKVDLVSAEIGELPANDVLELLTRDDLACVLLTFTAKTNVDVFGELCDLLLADVK